VGTTSPAQAVTLTNTGSAPLEITAIAATGDFAQTNTCPSTLVVGAVCIIHVTFTPTAVGNRYGTVTIADNAANSPQTIILGGTGLSAPAVSLSASTLSFGSQVVNTTSAAQVVTVTNTGTATLTLASITATAPFAQTNTCGSPVAAGGICTISVTFTPTAAGSAVGSVTLVDNAGSSPQTISLTGTGVTAPIASLSPASVTFTTPQAVGTTSAPLTVTLTNPGSATLIIVGITASANFGETNNCGASVGVGGSCSIYVTFTPTAVGNLYGTLTVTDNNNGAPASTQVVPLAGSGLSAPAVAFSPASLAFANQIVNTASAPLNVTLSNTGSAVLNIASITTSGDFAQTNTCGTSLANGTSCTISVTFTPTAAGPRAGAIIVTDNAPGSPHQVPLTGSGLLAPIVTLAPGSLTFTGQPVGSTSAPQTVILTNTGSAALNITTMAASGNFAQTNTCGASVAPGISCTITVTFTPTAPGSRYGSVTLTDNAVNSPQTIGLAGDGLPAPVASLSTLSLTFPSQALGTTSAPQTVTLSDTGTAALIITSIVATGDFAQIDTCGTSLAVGASCTISVTFAPTAAGSRTGAITINDNAPGSPQVVNLGGSGAGFGVSVTPISATVIAGDSVAYTLSVAPSFGFNASVILGCAGAPRNATCSVSPASVTPNGTNPATATVTVTTGQRSLAPPGSGPNLNLPRLVTRVRPTWFLWLLLFLTVLTCQAMARRRRALLRLALVMGLLLLWAACGGGGSQVDVPNGTPAGNYTLTLSGTSGNVTRNVSASLTVK